MRISSQNNQFILNLPTDLLSKDLSDKFQLYIDKNHIPYDNAIDYLNSTIKDVNIPGLNFDFAKQTMWKGKSIEYRETGNVIDKQTRSFDISFRSVDSNINYFMMFEIFILYYLDNDKKYVPPISISLLDKNGDVLYSIVFKNVLFKSMSDLRLQYNSYDIQEKQFSISLNYVWFDIVWETKRLPLDSGMSIYHLPKYQSCTGKTYR